jgi:di/tricarboxylate transporter
LGPSGVESAPREIEAATVGPGRSFRNLNTPVISLAAGGATIAQSMTPTDAQQQQLLKHLRQAGENALPFTELHDAGITFPAAVVSELELNGYVIQRVRQHGRPVAVRLLEPEPPITPAAPRWRKRQR